jgi:hypothetical protein
MTIASLARWRWVVAGVAVMVAALVVTFLVQGDGSSGPDRADPTPTPAGSPSASGPVCRPVIRESGFGTSGGSVLYGLVIENLCPEVAINTAVPVQALDASGAILKETGAVVPVILPGQKTGIGGSLTVGDGVAKVTDLTARIGNVAWLPAAGFAAWPKATAEQVTLGARDQSGSAPLSYSVRTDPPGATLCSPMGHVLLRNTAGKIVSGASGKIDGSPVQTTVAVRDGVDPSRTEVFIVQGRVSLVVEQVACANSR